MKRYKYFLILMAVGTILAACGLDNYDAPDSILSGKVTYKGEPLGLRGTGEAVQLQLYQDGYELRDNIPVYVKQDGNFQARLFDGEYKLVTRNQNGPWVNERDTIVINLRGTTSVEVEVTPYFTISNETISLNGAVMNASFEVNQIVNTAEMDYISLLVSKTSFVDDVSYIARKDFRDLQPDKLSLSMDMSENGDFAAAKYLYARVGVRTKGADQAVYSKIVQLR
ncbi:DUF3823 domain-containing protein [Proteiniphilum sp. UBA5384]|uniref:DUF3823 domain-containing protein n=1 Tax=Proteiniphilum sp. UBA5384 TaxID=1947279 RepID=UPI0025F12C29|nr:DUF3823 domain-containing protein [Proteiniphilum sp. UBA5384]